MSSLILMKFYFCPFLEGHDQKDISRNPRNERGRKH